MLIEQNSYGYSVLDQKYWMATDKGLVWAHEKDLMSHDFDTIPIAVTKIISDHVFTAEEVSRVNFDNTLHIKREKVRLTLCLHVLPRLICQA